MIHKRKWMWACRDVCKYPYLFPHKSTGWGLLSSLPPPFCPQVTSWALLMDHGSPTVQLPKLSPLLLELTSFLAGVQDPQSSSPLAALPRPRRGPDATPTWLPLLDLPPLTLRAPQLQEGFPGGTSGKVPTCQCRRCKRCRFDPWVRKILWRKKWQPTPVFLCGKSHGQRSWQATVHEVTKSWTQLSS